jgi:hypothetical protein
MTTVYVVEQMIVFDDDVVQARKYPLCETSMSAFTLLTTKLLVDIGSVD